MKNRYKIVNDNKIKNSDEIFGSYWVGKIMNSIMIHGKKIRSHKQIYKSLILYKYIYMKHPIMVLHKIFEISKSPWYIREYYKKLRRKPDYEIKPFISVWFSNKNLQYKKCLIEIIRVIKDKLIKSRGRGYRTNKFYIRFIEILKDIGDKNYLKIMRMNKRNLIDKIGKFQWTLNQKVRHRKSRNRKYRKKWKKIYHNKPLRYKL